MTLTINTSAGALVVTVSPGEVLTAQNLARVMRLEGLPLERCGGLGRLLAAMAECGFKSGTMEEDT